MNQETEQALEIIAKNILIRPIEDVGIRVRKPEKWKARKLGSKD